MMSLPAGCLATTLQHILVRATMEKAGLEPEGRASEGSGSVATFRTCGRRPLELKFCQRRYYMADMTLDDARKQLRLAREALKAVGVTPLTAESPQASGTAGAQPFNAPVTCENLVTAVAVLTWFAAQAALQGGNSNFYLQAAQQIEQAAAVAWGWFVPEPAVSRCSNKRRHKQDLFDHLVGGKQKRRRNRQAKRLGGF